MIKSKEKRKKLAEHMANKDKKWMLTPVGGYFCSIKNTDNKVPPEFVMPCIKPIIDIKNLLFFFKNWSLLNIFRQTIRVLSNQ